jgi:hypothetical protein
MAGMIAGKIGCVHGLCDSTSSSRALKAEAAEGVRLLRSLRVLEGDVSESSCVVANPCICPQRNHRDGADIDGFIDLVMCDIAPLLRAGTPAPPCATLNVDFVDGQCDHRCCDESWSYRNGFRLIPMCSNPLTRIGCAILPSTIAQQHPFVFFGAVRLSSRRSLRVFVVKKEH